MPRYSPASVPTGVSLNYSSIWARARPTSCSAPSQTVLADEGIELISSTQYLEPLLAKPGVLTRRAPSEDERKDIAYGLTVARGLAAYDLGQTVVIAAQACVAVEAMEGTDATIERAGSLFRVLGDASSTLSRSLTVVKVAKPMQDTRFDVPVIGLATIEAMARAGATCLAVEAGEHCCSTPLPSSTPPIAPASPSLRNPPRHLRDTRLIAERVL